MERSHLSDDLYVAPGLLNDKYIVEDLLSEDPPVGLRRPF